MNLLFVSLIASCFRQTLRPLHGNLSTWNRDVRRKFWIIALTIAASSQSTSTCFGAIVVAEGRPAVEAVPNASKNQTFSYELMEGLPKDFLHFAKHLFPRKSPEAALKLAIEKFSTDEYGSINPTRPSITSGLESIQILDPVQRPALYAGYADLHPTELIPRFWIGDLRNQRHLIKQVLASVGRIESHNLEQDLGHPVKALGVAHGTGFILAPGIVATNRHVAVEFVDDSSKTFRTSSVDGRPAEVWMDFGATLGGDSAPRCRVSEIVFMGPKNWD